MIMHRQRMLLVILISSCLSGCGVQVPEIREAWEQDAPAVKLGSDAEANDPEIPGIVVAKSKKFNEPTAPMSGSARIEYEVKKRVYCELRKAVKAANYFYLIENERKKKHDKEQGYLARAGIPPNWGVQVTLSLEADEDTSLNPGLTLNTPMHNGVVNFGGEYIGSSSISGTGLLNAAPAAFTFGPLTGILQSFNFGFGGTLSSTGTRIDKYNPYYSIADLLQDPPTNGQPYMFCKDQSGEDAVKYDAVLQGNEKFGISSPNSSLFLHDDLGITEWLLGSTLVNWLIPSSETPASGLTIVADAVCGQKKKNKSEADKQDDDSYTHITQEYLECRRKNPDRAEQACDELKKKSQAATKKYIVCLREELGNLGFDKPAADLIIASKASPSSSAAGGGGSSAAGGASNKPDIISLEEKFIIVTNGTVTPSWKLVRVSANQSTSTPFFGTGRTRTHDLIITVGPPTPATADAHNNLAGPSAGASANKAAGVFFGSP